ncbi:MULTISPECIES: outer membrane protein [Rhizobium/Agrobacterium group]|uniref:Porin family protein n=1 Tax=Agrobacterium tumefaciens TaxID=358 RepID=A0A546Y336_AGRTU|nr:MULTISPECIES: outer membrane protein [Rhizobium/Agrobacterium group]MBO0126993.1 porin family protein [Agrobacterium sp. OT33]PYG58472.1 opacity protein-like surface antigen [Rhizobium sp. UGM030330-04]TRB07366.1 porin family protein [Agrobacterium tumefaciens]
MKNALAGFLAVLLTGTSAVGADLYQAEPAPAYVEAPEVQITQASGWYLRGDVGYSFNKLRGAHYYQGGPGGYLQDFETAKIKDSYIIGAGVGYQFNNYFRSDVTFDYMGKSDFRGSTVGGCGSVTGPCVSTDLSSLQAYTLMANAYVDLGTYGRVTPYVGGGIGGSYVKWDKLRNTSCSTNGLGCDPTTEHGGKGKWRFAYALMAGASIDVTCNLKADIGYRFRHINKGDMFAYENGGGPGRDKGLYSHEVRVGGRYVFNGCDTAQYMPPADIPLQPAVYK